ncbi:L,D-transpeptidase family protein [Rhizobium sp. 3T7]|uniref:L,D-transpeptidase family protein n=1 Tax=Rhizobium sp. 3T7 TaxID=2874922 RepID=UPI00398CB6F9
MSVSFEHKTSRRSFLSLSAMAAVSGLAGCASTSGPGRLVGPQLTPVPGPIRPVQVAPAPTDAELAVMYGPIEDGGYLIPAVPYQQIDPRYYRQQVVDPTGERPGTIVVETPSRFLYLVQPGGTAMRYGVGIGREGFAWQGKGVIQWRQKWPRWKPPNEMVARQPELAKYSIENGGMEPGLKNPAAVTAPALADARNIVLVHGALVDGSGWRGVYDILTRDGYNVSIVQQPLTSLDQDVAATRSVLDQQDGDVVLVGHSYGDLAGRCSRKGYRGSSQSCQVAAACILHNARVSMNLRAASRLGT